MAMMAAAVFLISKPSKKVKKIVRRYHVRPSIKARKIYSTEDLLRDLRMDDTHPVTKEVTVCGYFKNFLRISCEDFEWLSNELGPHIGKSDTNFRQAIGVNTKLAYTLRFLATEINHRRVYSSCMQEHSESSIRPS